MQATKSVKKKDGVYYIDLNAWRGSEQNRVVSGRDFGETARDEVQLSSIDSESDATVEINVPSDFIAVTSSFFRGMFGDSIRNLGEAKFRSRFRFVGKNIDRVKEDGIRDALREKLPLSRRA